MVRRRAALAVALVALSPLAVRAADEAAVEPFLAAGIALGDFDLLAELAYEWNLNAHVGREQTLGAGGAIGYRAFRRFTPLVEVTTLSQTRGGESDARSLRGKTQVYV